MSRSARLALIALATGSLAAWSATGSSAAVSATRTDNAKAPVLSAAARRGLAFAQVRCAGCHGLTADASSPNPESPPFEAVANTPGLTRSTLRQFLRDSHNYPQAMNFTVAPSDIEDLARFMLTLRRPSYRPAI